MGWDQLWHAEVPVRRLAWFRIAVAWICLYDAFLYDPHHLVANAERVEATWQPIVVFDLLGIAPPSAELTAALAKAYQGSVFAMLVGFRTRTVCLVVALLSFWQGGFYSLTKVRHDRVVLCCATFVLACCRSGADLSLDAWLQRRRASRAAPATAPAWPLRLTQVTLVIGYCAAGLTKLLHAGWMNGYTLQGIVIGHRGRHADLMASNVAICQAISVLTVAAEFLRLCACSGRAASSSCCPW
jgi:hypothetical protein